MIDLFICIVFVVCVFARWILDVRYPDQDEGIDG